MQITDFSHLLFRHKYWIFIARSIGIGLFIAISACIFAPKTYKSTATLLIKPGQYIELDSLSTATQFARHEHRLNSLVAVLRSPEVVGRAIDGHGVDRLYPDPGNGALVRRLTTVERRLLAAFGYGHASARDEAVTSIVESLTARVASRSDLVAVTLSHGDPQVASEFLNTLLDVFRQRTMELYGHAGAADFLSEKQKKYDAAYEASSNRLTAYALANKVFSVDEQRKLILGRQSELLAISARTRSGIAEKTQRAAMISKQLETLKPISSNPQIRALTSGLDRRSSASATAPERFENTPPLLLVKVYQQTAQYLVDAKSEISGLQALDIQNAQELQKIDLELKQIMESEAQFNRLKLQVDQARAEALQYSSVSAKEQLGAESEARGFSTIEIAQSAMAPLKPAFPNAMIVVPTGAIFGLLLGFAILLWRLKTGSDPTCETQSFAGGMLGSEVPTPTHGSDASVTADSPAGPGLDLPRVFASLRLPRLARQLYLRHFGNGPADRPERAR